MLIIRKTGEYLNNIKNGRIFTVPRRYRLRYLNDLYQNIVLTKNCQKTLFYSLER